MKIKKRTKSSRMRGRHNYGWGFKKKHRGSGHKGGKGMAGTGKRASQKEQKGLIIARKKGFSKYFGARGFTSAPAKKKNNKVINLRDIALRFHEKEIKLEGYKILGEGEGMKAKIYADSASASAVEKMEKAGGKIILSEDNSEEKVKGK